MPSAIALAAVLVLLPATFVLANTRQTEVPVAERKRIRLKTIVEDDVLQRFRQGQAITIVVPQNDDATVRSVVIRRRECFKSESLTVRTHTRLSNKNVIATISDRLFDRLDYQPIEILIFQSGIAQVVLVPDREQAPGQLSRSRTGSAEADFYLRLKPENGVAIAFPAGDKFELANELFKVDVPTQNIEAIFFDATTDSEATVVLRNGDNVTGSHSWPDSVEFETPWGPERIRLDQIVSITRNRNARLVRSGVANPRWVLQQP